MNNMLNYQKMGERIRKYRLSAYMTQEQLSELCGVTPASISRLETNAMSCSLPLLVSVAAALNVGLDALVCDSLPAVTSDYLDKDFSKLLSDCTAKEKRIIYKIAETTKKTLREQNSGI